MLTSSTASASRPQVTFKGQGPLGELQAIATSEGAVKGKVQAPKADPPLNAAGKLNVSSAIGKGFLAVVRNHHLMAQPYTGEFAAAPASPAWNLEDAVIVMCVWHLGRQEWCQSPAAR